jgi:hypothetical protein
MTTYRVGAQGATVFSSDGTPLCRLRPGQVVVEGSTELSGTPAADVNDLRTRRVRDYADKRIAPGDHEDKGF